MKECPHCQLKHANSAISCDCGYSFETGIQPSAPVLRRKAQEPNTEERIQKEQIISGHQTLALISMLLPVLLLFQSCRSYFEIKRLVEVGKEQTVQITEQPDTYRAKHRNRHIHKVTMDSVSVRVEFVNYDFKVGDSVEIIFDSYQLHQKPGGYFSAFIVGKKSDGVWTLMRKEYGQWFRLALFGLFGFPLIIGAYFSWRYFQSRKALSASGH